MTGPLTGAGSRGYDAPTGLQAESDVFVAVTPCQLSVGAESSAQLVQRRTDWCRGSGSPRMGDRGDLETDPRGVAGPSQACSVSGHCYLPVFHADSSGAARQWAPRGRGKLGGSPRSGAGGTVWRLPGCPSKWNTSAEHRPESPFPDFGRHARCQTAVLASATRTQSADGMLG